MFLFLCDFRGELPVGSDTLAWRVSSFFFESQSQGTPSFIILELFGDILITILKQYNVYQKLVVNSEGVLNPQLRKRLIKTIVAYTVDERIWIPVKQFPEVFKMIEIIFKGEPLDLYFWTVGGRPGGALYESYRYQHSLLKKTSHNLQAIVRRNPKYSHR